MKYYLEFERKNDISDDIKAWRGVKQPKAKRNRNLIRMKSHAMDSDMIFYEL